MGGTCSIHGETQTQFWSEWDVNIKMDLRVYFGMWGLDFGVGANGRIF
jgi:hypothetical protein